MLLEAGVGRGAAGVGGGWWTAGGSVAVLLASGTFCVLSSCVATGVGSGGAAAGSSAAGDGSGSACVVCASTTGGVGSGAAGLGAAAAGLRRAALGANFLPVVFSAQASARPRPADNHVRRSSLLIKELVKAAAADAGLDGCDGALSLPAAGGCVAPSSADMIESRSICTRRSGGEVVGALPPSFADHSMRVGR